MPARRSKIHALPGSDSVGLLTDSPRLTPAAARSESDASHDTYHTPARCRFGEPEDRCGGFVAPVRRDKCGFSSVYETGSSSLLPPSRTVPAVNWASRLKRTLGLGTTEVLRTSHEQTRSAVAVIAQSQVGVDFDLFFFCYARHGQEWQFARRSLKVGTEFRHGFTLTASGPRGPQRICRTVVTGPRHATAFFRFTRKLVMPIAVVSCRGQTSWKDEMYCSPRFAGRRMRA